MKYLICLFLLEIYETDNSIQDFKNVVAKLSKLEQDFESERSILNTFECSSIDSFDEDLKKTLAKNAKNRSQQSARYDSFESELEEARNSFLTENRTQNVDATLGDPTQDLDDVNADGMSSSFPIITTDPITKKWIVNPVRSSICKHVYDKESIEAALKVNSRLRCPYVGCSKMLDATVLKDDIVHKRLLQNMANRQEDSSFNFE